MNTLTLRRAALAYAGAAGVFLALDAVWLTLMAERLYRPLIGHLMRPDFDLVAAAVFYALYIAGIVVLAVGPSARLRGALARGAALGLVAYATYDLTNQATLQRWPWLVTGVDLVWGTFVTATASAAGWWLGQRAGRR